MVKSVAQRCADYRAKDVEAYRKKKAEYARTEQQRAKRTEYMRGWRDKNREKHNQQARESHHRNKHKYVEKQRNSHLLRKFGITLQQKKEMVEGQKGKCLICDLPFKSSRCTHVDHCHNTGKIRGILCNSCNTKLGWFEAFADRIDAYLQEN